MLKIVLLIFIAFIALKSTITYAHASDFDSTKLNDQHMQL